MASDALRNWSTLNDVLKTLDEDQCWKLLDEEKAGKRRAGCLLRIYGRANQLRGERERRELLGERTDKRRK